ncbi:hypothetical protein ANOBCDAF_00428 [Pleomorphomonas sp. T1.2MG-36]|uniref:helix-turn-helix transcriptional regulator n=1 Tax=Pleomorphomonas sp. T1.2MG-36 TaxID=3041167 RepID=UPI00247790E0|nr:LuxR C-terminal-related transcriptional regulator [Pleomorphomonas sp. T1.2MG-36]CAI9400161.1 hypothetical protein ANOBCDAF_00428 [Pleomorphomonas sp. T1.2MG-36]
MLDAFDCAISAWSSAKPNDVQSVFGLFDRCERIADSSTNITVYNVAESDPYDFRLEARRHNVDMRAKWTRLGEYADATYVQSSLVPFYLDARESAAPAMDTVRTRIQDVFAVYDRLLLPCGGNKKRAEFLLSFTKTRLVIPLSPRFQPLSGEDSTVLSLLAQGHSRNAIAAHLRLSMRTIDAIFDRLSERFGAATEAQLIAMAIAQEIVREA